jgi:hypothetical protein
LAKNKSAAPVNPRFQSSHFRTGSNHVNPISELLYGGYRTDKPVFGCRSDIRVPEGEANVDSCPSVGSWPCVRFVKKDSALAQMGLELLCEMDKKKGFLAASPLHFPSFSHPVYFPP